MNANREYKRRRQLAELVFPCRLTFDAPIVGVAQLANAADAHFGFSHGGQDRIAFYFSSPEKMMRFVERFGPGRHAAEAEITVFSQRPTSDHSWSASQRQKSDWK